MAVPVADLPGVQRGPAERARLGRRDVDRHRARPRPARDARPQRARPGPPVPADGLRRRRPGGTARHRRRLQRADRRACRWCSRWWCSRCCSSRLRLRCGSAGVRRSSGWSCGRAAGQRRRPGRRRAGHRAVGLGVHPEPRRRWRRRPGWCGSSASSRRPSWRGRPRPASPSTLSPERAAADLLPPVDELRDRPAVRAGQRRHRAERATSSATRTPRRSRSACSSATSSASRSAVVGDVVGGDPAQPRPDPAAGRLGRRDRQRDDRGHRLHRRAAHRDPRVPRGASWTRRRSARCPPSSCPRR